MSKGKGINCVVVLVLFAAIVKETSYETSLMTISSVCFSEK